MAAISELFAQTHLVLPLAGATVGKNGLEPLSGNAVSVVELTTPAGRGIWRKFGFPLWLIRNGRVIAREFKWADAIHAPIPGDVGTVALALALLFRKPLFVRHCGNWFATRTAAEWFWRWVMEKFAGGRNVMLATGGGTGEPSSRNAAVRWIFSTSLTTREMYARTRIRIAPHDPARLVIACRQEPGKGTDLVIETLAALPDRMCTATLDIAGEGSCLAALKQLAIDRGVDRRVRFHGRLSHSDLMDLFSQADLFCYPTTSEGFPKVVLEALASGLPVITTNTSVLPVLIGNEAGKLVDEPTPVSLAASIVECLGNGYSAMSTAAVQTAAKYTLDEWRCTLARILRDAWGQDAVRC